jgi:sortase A
MKYLRVLGKFLISVGVGILMFVGWTLWGTGIYHDRAQHRLTEKYETLPSFTPESLASPEDGDGDDPGPVVEEPELPGPGDPVFKLIIPEIDVDEWVVEGVDVTDLQAGPGHYPECREGFEEPLCTHFPEVFPGEEGRVVVSGHRTTYGAPFWDLNKLQPGDEIITNAKWGRFTYVVTKQEIVHPNSAVIVIPSDRAEIVLTTCNPRFSAEERLVVFAEMVPTATS